jgi:transcriptional regulator with XRE-family HTH domain
MTNTISLESGKSSKKRRRSRNNQLVDPLIGYRIRLLRVGKKIAIKAVAQRLSVTIRKMDDYESGMAPLTVGQLYSLATLFAVDTNYFYQDFSELEDVIDFNDIAPNLAKELSRLCRAYLSLEDKALRKSLIDLVKSMDPAKIPTS